jgi:hypothetical protein
LLVDFQGAAIERLGMRVLGPRMQKHAELIRQHANGRRVQALASRLLKQGFRMGPEQ